jgi:hypothetical protein
MSRRTLPGLFIGACGILAEMAALQATPAESAPKSMSAFSDNVTVNSQKRTVAERLSTPTIARGAARDSHDRDSALRARNSFEADQTRAGFPGELAHQGRPPGSAGVAVAV